MSKYLEYIPIWFAANYNPSMSKKAHNIGKKKDLLRSVHAGHLPCDCPVARRLIDQRLPLIAWCTDLAALLFRPNPLVKTTPGTQARAEDLAKGSPWFSGYAQALAGNVATRINAVENICAAGCSAGSRVATRRPSRSADASALPFVPNRPKGRPAGSSVFRSPG